MPLKYRPFLTETQKKALQELRDHGDWVDCDTIKERYATLYGLVKNKLVEERIKPIYEPLHVLIQSSIKKDVYEFMAIKDTGYVIRLKNRRISNLVKLLKGAGKNQPN